MTTFTLPEGVFFTLYARDANDKEWLDKSTYKKIYTIENTLHLFPIAKPKVSFFLFRGNIFPTYEDPHNKKYGAYSIYYEAPEIQRAFHEIGLAFMNGTLTANKEDAQCITGIALIPKRDKYVIKIWVGAHFPAAAPPSPNDFFRQHEPIWRIPAALYLPHDR